MTTFRSRIVCGKIEVPMPKATLLLVLLMLSGTISPASPTAAAEWWTPEAGLTWQIQFSGSDIDPSLDVDVYDLDGWDTDVETIESLHERGIRVVCYISVGTFEDWRPDAGQYPDEILGNSWDEWEGERFVDIRRIDLLTPIIEARFDMCRDKGFDAIEPDNIDSYGGGLEGTGFDLTEADQLAFNQWIAEEAHERGLAIGQKNVPELTTDLEPDYDFAITEDCFVDGWCEEMLPYIEHDKPVFAIEYTDVDANLAEICPKASDMEFSVVLKNRDLDAWRNSCP
jgi:hypothetical protein